MANEKQTHWLSFKKEGETGYNKQAVYGMTELFNLIRSMTNDGFTEFQISTLKK
jgi:hypothetical protein